MKIREQKVSVCQCKSVANKGDVMKIIEIDKGIFINIDKVFKIEMVRLEKSEKCYLKFFSGSEGNYAISKEFDDFDNAREWLSMQTIRAGATKEIIEL